MDVHPSEMPRKPTGRLRMIDGLRGLAALYVVLFHLSFRDTSPLYPVLHRLPGPFWWFLSHGYLGVEIFFVLSGFVIARSLRNDRVSGGLLARFVARRSIRLDLPYWTVLTLVVSAKYLAFRLNPHETWFAGHGFSGLDVLANYTYVGMLVGRPIVLGVSWTLCLELLFYLSYASLLGIAQPIRPPLQRRGPGQPSRLGLLCIFGPTLLVSLVCYYVLGFGLRGDVHNGFHTYLSFWHMFLVGALLQWTVERWTPAGWLYLTIASLFVLAGYRGYRFHELDWTGVMAGATALAIYVAARLNRWNDWLSCAPLQWAGSVSYSLYLIHVPICTVTLAIAVRLCHGANWKAVLVGLPLAVSATAAATLLLYRLVELPSLRLSHRIPVHTAHKPQPQRWPAPVPARALESVPS